MSRQTKALRLDLPTPQEGWWHSRWLVLPSWNRLHRVAEGEWDENEWAVIDGVTVCGLRGRLIIPGFLSRMGLPRCAHCCDKVGIPRGNGAPFNTLKGQAQNA